MELDLLDRKILYYLDENSRQSMTQLSKKIKTNKNVLLYRINRLKEKEIIKGSFTVINNSLLGYKNFRIFLKINNASVEERDQLFEFVQNSNNIMWFSQVLGKWDLDIVFTSKKIQEFQIFLEKLELKFNSIIEKKEISLLSKIYHYPKSYIYPELKKERIPTILENNGEDYLVDRKDEAILEILSSNAQINILEIAKKSNLSINTIKSRIRNLEKNKIILNYRILIDPQKMGYEYYKFHLNLKNYSNLDLIKLRNWLETQKFVIYTDHYINGENFEIELHLKKEKEYLEFLEELKNEFGKMIKNYFLIKFYDLRVYKYLPSKK